MRIPVWLRYGAVSGVYGMGTVGIKNPLYEQGVILLLGSSKMKTSITTIDDRSVAHADEKGGSRL